jgi:hypothetical protein
MSPKSFSRFVQAAIASAVLLLLSACASGPTYSQWSAGAPALAPEKGRIFVYRESSIIAAGLHPSVSIDGVKVGDSVPGGFFFVDVAPGKHVVTMWPENMNVLDVTLAAGETIYVETPLTGPNLSIQYPVLALRDKSVGEPGVKECLYNGM